MTSIWTRLFGGGKEKREKLLKALRPPSKSQLNLKQKKSWVYNPATRRYEPPSTPAAKIKKRFETGTRRSGRR